jgi:glycosyltransferase involved in cell wall biosynthesis
VIDLTLIIPLYNEEESLVPLIQWIEQVVSDKYDYEIILVDDGSLDGSWGIIEDLASGNKRIRAFKFRRNYGKSAALHTGFEASRGRVVITMDADMQDSPDEIPALCDMINNGGFDLVSGWKKKRHDPITKTIPSKFFNWFVRRVSGIKVPWWRLGWRRCRGSEHGREECCVSACRCTKVGVLPCTPLLVRGQSQPHACSRAWRG